MSDVWIDGEYWESKDIVDSYENEKKLIKENKALKHECSEFEKALEIMRAQLQKALNNSNGDICTKCGCTEFLCGHNKRE